MPAKVNKYIAIEAVSVLFPEELLCYFGKY